MLKMPQSALPGEPVPSSRTAPPTAMARMASPPRRAARTPAVPRGNSGNGMSASSSAGAEQQLLGQRLPNTSHGTGGRTDGNHRTGDSAAFFIIGTDNLIICNSAQGAMLACDIAGNHDAARVTSPARPSPAPAVGELLILSRKRLPILLVVCLRPRPRKRRGNHFAARCVHRSTSSRNIFIRATNARRRPCCRPRLWSCRCPRSDRGRNAALP